MEIVLVSATAALASLLTFFTGFGLATALTPVMLLFFAPAEAIALTALVHLLNNLFKYALTRRHIDWRTALRFGIPAGFGAFAGAELLRHLPADSVIAGYRIAEHAFVITPIKLTVGTLMVLFALFETVPRLKNLRFSENKIYAGGLISGFFGGLSGHQGALRSAFLIRGGLDKEVFIATGIAIACAVDLVRLVIYQPFASGFAWQAHGQLLIAATLAACSGAFAGNLLLKKATIGSVQLIVALAVSLMGIVVAAGLI